MKSMVFSLAMLFNFAPGYAMKEGVDEHEKHQSSKDIKVKIIPSKEREYIGLFAKKMEEWYGGTKPRCLFCESCEACDM